MARLVNVIDDDDNYEFQRRQVPLDVDNMQFVVQFSDKCVDCDCEKGIKQKDLEVFTAKFHTLSKDEIAVALLVSRKDITGLLAQMVPCVGCRKSVERLFSQLQKSQYPALEPLVITPRGELSVKHGYLFDPRSLFSLFHVHSSKLLSVVESIPKSKKNKRCNLHSLETHKTKTLGCWLEAWDSLSELCREQVLVVETNDLLTTVDSYLEKHKFCSECKTKVLLAYSILVGEKDSTVEKGYCAALYENLRCCAQERHMHVLNDTDFISHLLDKAEPEYLGGKRDRHAKTLDIAQEEVLTCLGIFIFERLHAIWQKLRAEEQTWFILFYVGMDALRKSYHVALEEKQGASNLELLCEELEEKEKRQTEKKEMKKQKRRQRKAKVQQGETPSGCGESVSDSSPTTVVHKISSCMCGSVENDNFKNMKSNNCSKAVFQNNSRNHHHLHLNNKSPCSGDANFNSLTLSLQGCGSCDLSSAHGSNGHGSAVGKKEECSGGGAWAEEDSCESCSMQGSNEGSEEGECSGSYTDSVDSCECDMLRSSPSRSKRQKKVPPLSCSTRHNKVPFLPSEQPFLQDLLDDLGMEDEDEDDPGISEEEILAFRARQGDVDSKRQELRQNLKDRFAEFHLSRHHDSM